jgi:hypothetical protein
MANHRIAGFACLLVLFSVLGASAPTVAANSTGAYFTFSAPVRMPGVLLPAGTYVFDRPSQSLDPTIVRVMDRRTSKLYLIAFTRLVQRPADGKLDTTIRLSEASKGVPRPVSVWFPQGQTIGHQFIY